ncbi:hypothetical protein P3T24_003541 [Paraburkholderia sp. GAS33]|jgi:hypothetical protein|uniref:hypothetical protein n=1 Tax=unclassified Paraburkholderia TaxID=2615204 RepID=UPI003D2631BE
MKNCNTWFVASILVVVSFGVHANPTLSCDADKGSISHSLEITEKGSGVPDFSYLSSTPSQGLALNCTIDSTLVNGTPTVSGSTVTYPLSSGDSLSITKQPHGYLLDMSKMDAANYCSGIVAKKVSVSYGKKKCDIR